MSVTVVALTVSAVVATFAAALLVNGDPAETAARWHTEQVRVTELGSLAGVGRYATLVRDTVVRRADGSSEHIVFPERLRVEVGQTRTVHVSADTGKVATDDGVAVQYDPGTAAVQDQGALAMLLALLVGVTVFFASTRAMRNREYTLHKKVARWTSTTALARG
jgi:hypothetical protein